MIVTRFAPSPTGFLHIGGARTALFNWLYTKAQGGKFLLRIEDTDMVRSTPEATRAIIDGLRWLGIHWDGDIVMQSERISRHREIALQMLERGTAYRCYLSPQDIEEMKKADAYAKISSPWRDKNEHIEGKPYAIRIKAPLEGSSTIQDLVQGDVTINNDQLDDMVLLRSDGTPTYMLAVVVDDHDMGVTQVIRGDDHLTNAFRQEQIYKAMGWTSPTYAHIPLIHDAEGQKLSKRLGAVNVGEYKDKGYLPAAICNYLLRLGWGGGGEEIIDIMEAAQSFNIAAVSKAPARFSWDKLNYFNAHYLRNSHNDDLWLIIEKDIERLIGASGLDQSTDYEHLKTRIRSGLDLMKLRATTLIDIVEMSKLYIARSEPEDSRCTEVLQREVAGPILESLFRDLELLEDLADIKGIGEKVAAEHSCKVAVIKQTLQAALLGTANSPAIYDMMLILGRDEIIKRLRNILSSIKAGVYRM